MLSSRISSHLLSSASRRLRCISSSTGLVGIPELQDAQDWRVMVDKTKDKCLALVKRILSALSGIEIVRRTDELSDTICKTFDAAELCRNVHGSPEWRAEAQNACVNLGEFLTQLNTHAGIYEALQSAVKTSQQQAAAQHTATDAVSGTALRVAQMLLYDFEMHGVHLGDADQKRFNAALAEEQMLCIAFGQNLGSPSNAAVAARLVHVRQTIAQLLGASCYSGYQASRHTLAQHPSAIRAFLRQLSDTAHDKAVEEVGLLQKANGGRLPSLQDEARLRSRAQGKQLEDTLCTLPECLHMLNEICERLFDAKLQVASMAPGEAWAPDIQKWVLVDSSGIIGHLYLDLYSRVGKVQGAGMQYTLVSGRRLSDGSYQRPVVALVCNFPHDSPRLSVTAVETLFHEFGHVLNALLNKTEFQHVAGTRGTSDLVETPSQLFEYFALDGQTFGRDAAAATVLHHHLGQQRDFAALDLQRQIFHARLDQELHSSRDFGGRPSMIAEVMRELIHETLPFALPRDDGALLQPLVQFNHLAMGGSKYYTYLYSKCIAAAVWQQHLAGNPFSPAAGRHIQQHLLEIGTSTDPCKMVRGLIGDKGVVRAAQGYHPHAEAMLAGLGLP